jgi:hypothetical protein
VFSADPSQMVRPNGCNLKNAWTVDRALGVLNTGRERFDYLWLIDVPPLDERLLVGMRPVWRGPGSILYQINP